MGNASSPEGEVDLSFLLQQLQDLVKFSMECETKDLKPSASFIEIHKELLKIRQSIALFQENYKNHLALVGLTPEDVRPTPADLEQLSPKDKKIVDQLKSLTNTCEEARERVYMSLKEDKATVQQVSEELKDKKTARARRKGKFRGAGGQKGWLPT